MLVSFFYCYLNFKKCKLVSIKCIYAYVKIWIEIVCIFCQLIVTCNTNTNFSSNKKTKGLKVCYRLQVAACQIWECQYFRSDILLELRKGIPRKFAWNFRIFTLLPGHAFILYLLCKNPLKFVFATFFLFIVTAYFNTFLSTYTFTYSILYDAITLQR